MLNSSLNKRINDLFIFKLYFLFGRMHIYIYHGRVKVNEQSIHRETVVADYFLVCIHHCMVQVSTLDKTVIDKEILVAPRFLGCLWFADKAIYIHVIGFFFYRY